MTWRGLIDRRLVFALAAGALTPFAASAQGDVYSSQGAQSKQIFDLEVSNSAIDLHHALSIELQVDQVAPPAEELWKRGTPLVKKYESTCYQEYAAAHDLVPKLQEEYRARDSQAANETEREASTLVEKADKCSDDPIIIAQAWNLYTKQTERRGGGGTPSYPAPVAVTPQPGWNPKSGTGRPGGGTQRGNPPQRGGVQRGGPQRGNPQRGNPQRGGANAGLPYLPAGAQAFAERCRDGVLHGQIRVDPPDRFDNEIYEHGKRPSGNSMRTTVIYVQICASHNVGDKIDAPIDPGADALQFSHGWGHVTPGSFTIDRLDGYRGHNLKVWLSR